MSWSGSVANGVRASNSTYGRFTESDTYYDWTNQTQFAIAQVQAPPVPDPASGAMAAAGIVLLGALRRRRSTSGLCGS